MQCILHECTPKHNIRLVKTTRLGRDSLHKTPKASATMSAKDKRAMWNKLNRGIQHAPEHIQDHYEKLKGKGGAGNHDDNELRPYVCNIDREF